MDVHGGKGICSGPKNYLGRGYQVVPVAITVEGANILTRSLIIFGQGAVRCHPFVLREMNAARNPDRAPAWMSSTARCSATSALRSPTPCARFVMALTLGALHARARCRARPRATTSTSCASARRSPSPSTSRCWRSAAISRRRRTCRRGSGDVLSCMYLASMVLKHHENQGRQAGGSADRRVGVPQPALQAQEQLHGFLRNFPNRPLAALMRVLIFPRGLDLFGARRPARRSVAALVMNRPRRASGCAGSHLPDARAAAIRSDCCRRRCCSRVRLEPLEKRIRVEGVKTGRVTALDLPGRIQQALASASSRRPKRRRCASTTARSWTSSTSMTSRRTSSRTQAQPAARSSVHVA